MKILSSFTHPQVVPNLYECLCSAEHKGRYSEECGKQSSSGAPLTSIVFFPYYGSQWCPKTAWLQIFFRISSFVFSRTKKFIQVRNYLRVNKWWQNFHFWVNYPFNRYVYPNYCCYLWKNERSMKDFSDTQLQSKSTWTMPARMHAVMKGRRPFFYYVNKYYLVVSVFCK